MPIERLSEDGAKRMLAGDPLTPPPPRLTPSGDVPDDPPPIRRFSLTPIPDSLRGRTRPASLRAAQCTSITWTKVVSPRSTKPRSARAERYPAAEGPVEPNVTSPKSRSTAARFGHSPRSTARKSTVSVSPIVKASWRFVASNGSTHQDQGCAARDCRYREPSRRAQTLPCPGGRGMGLTRPAGASASTPPMPNCAIARLTIDEIGRRVMLDDHVRSSPTITSRAMGGDAAVTKLMKTCSPTGSRRSAVMSDGDALLPGGTDQRRSLIGCAAGRKGETAGRVRPPPGRPRGRDPVGEKRPPICLIDRDWAYRSFRRK